MLEGVTRAELRQVAKLQSVNVFHFRAGRSAQAGIRITHVIALFIAMPVTVSKCGMRKHDSRPGLAQMGVLRLRRSGESRSYKKSKHQTSHRTGQPPESFSQMNLSNRGMSRIPGLT